MKRIIVYSAALGEVEAVQKKKKIIIIIIIMNKIKIKIKKYYFSPSKENFTK